MPIIVPLEPYFIEQERKYAETTARERFPLYKSRNPKLSLFKLEDDFLIASFLEMAVYISQHNDYPGMGPPSLATIPQGQASFGYSDLGGGNHVKSVEKKSAQRYGLSWTFQAGIGRHLDPLVKGREGHTIWLTEVDVTNNCVTILAAVPSENVPNLLKPMRLEHLSNKKAIYWDDVPEEFRL